MSQKETGWSVFGKLTGSVFLLGFGIVMFVLGTFTSAYVVMKFWNWYMPAFGMASIGLYQAMGLDMLVMWLTLHATKKVEVDKGEPGIVIWKAICHDIWICVLRPLVYLGIGWGVVWASVKYPAAPAPTVPSGLHVEK